MNRADNGEHGWLRDVLQIMRDDLDEIKQDVKALQKSKSMFDGGKEAVRLIVTIAVTLFTLWMSHK
jgi:hypothetical protein